MIVFLGDFNFHDMIHDVNKILITLFMFNIFWFAIFD